MFVSCYRVVTDDHCPWFGGWFFLFFFKMWGIHVSTITRTPVVRKTNGNKSLQGQGENFHHSANAKQTVVRTYFSLKVEVRRYFLRTLYQFIVPEFKVVICTAIMYQIGILTYSIPLSFFLSLFGNQLYYLTDPTPTIILSIYCRQIRTYIYASYT